MNHLVPCESRYLYLECPFPVYLECPFPDQQPWISDALQSGEGGNFRRGAKWKKRKQFWHQIRERGNSRVGIWFMLRIYVFCLFLFYRSSLKNVGAVHLLPSSFKTFLLLSRSDVFSDWEQNLSTGQESFCQSCASAIESSFVVRTLLRRKNGKKAAWALISRPQFQEVCRPQQKGPWARKYKQVKKKCL